MGTGSGAGPRLADLRSPAAPIAGKFCLGHAAGGARAVEPGPPMSPRPAPGGTFRKLAALFIDGQWRRSFA
jgi:hypothetical protein